MKGHDQVVTLLNDILTAELTAINQYFIHARMCENWGYKRLWKKLREESIGEMRHADRLIERVLYLEGVPNVQRLGKVNVGQTVPEQLKLDLELERAAVAALNGGVEQCRGLGDNGVFVIPDILANAGGVTVSYFEWVQDRQGLFWTEKEVNDRLRDVIEQSFEEVIRYAEAHHVNNRVAAYMLAIDRVAFALKERGIYA